MTFQAVTFSNEVKNSFVSWFFSSVGLLWLEGRLHCVHALKALSRSEKTTTTVIMTHTSDVSTDSLVCFISPTHPSNTQLPVVVVVHMTHECSPVFVQ